MVQRDAGTEGKEEIEPLPASGNPAEDELVPAEASAIPQPILEKTGPSPSFFSFLKRMWSV